MKKNFLSLIFLVLCIFFTTASMWDDAYNFLNNNGDNDNNEYVIKVSNKTTDYLVDYFIFFGFPESGIDLHDVVYKNPTNYPQSIKSGEIGVSSVKVYRHIKGEISFPIADVVPCLENNRDGGGPSFFVYMLPEKKESFEKNYYNGHPLCEYPPDLATHIAFTNNNREMDVEFSNASNVPV